MSSKNKISNEEINYRTMVYNKVTWYDFRICTKTFNGF